MVVAVNIKRSFGMFPSFLSTFHSPKSPGTALLHFPQNELMLSNSTPRDPLPPWYRREQQLWTASTGLLDGPRTALEPQVGSPLLSHVLDLDVQLALLHSIHNGADGHGQVLTPIH